MSGQQVMHIGLDDTDSTKGGCTTYLAALLIEELEKLHVEFTDYPSLIRLNPNVPWKTRGNGALCLRFSYDAKYEEQIKELALNLMGRKLRHQRERHRPRNSFFQWARNSCRT